MYHCFFILIFHVFVTAKKKGKSVFPHFLEQTDPRGLVDLSLTYFMRLPLFLNFDRSNPRGYSIKKFSQKFYKIHRKTSAPESLFFSKIAGPLLKKRLCHRCFPCEFCEFSKNTFSTEHLRATASPSKTSANPSMTNQMFSDVFRE